MAHESETLGTLRKEMYAWLKANGIDIDANKQLHDEFKALLVKYADARTKNLSDQIQALNVHMQRCRLARKEKGLHGQQRNSVQSSGAKAPDKTA